MKSILFVDDNAVLCRLSCDILRTEGYHAVGAFSAADALTAVDREDFDLVVTDLRMDGMDGLQLADALHTKAPALPVIMVTAYGPVASKHLKLCLPKEGLFPTRLHHSRDCLAEPEPILPGRK